MNKDILKKLDELNLHKALEEISIGNFVRGGLWLSEQGKLAWNYLREAAEAKDTESVRTKKAKV